MNIDRNKLDQLAEEFEQAARTKTILIDDARLDDSAKQSMNVEIANLKRWAKTIREALK